jgi:hypothetical protein
LDGMAVGGCACVMVLRAVVATTANKKRAVYSNKDGDCITQSASCHPQPRRLGRVMGVSAYRPAKDELRTISVGSGG